LQVITKNWLMSIGDGHGQFDSEAPIPVDDDSLHAPRWAVNQARREVETWDVLDNIRLSNDSRWLRVYGWLMLVVTVVFTLAFLTAFVIWGWHHVAKQEWVWLEQVQLDKIQSVLFSGGMGAVISGIVRTQLSKARNSND